MLLLLSVFVFLKFFFASFKSKANFTTYGFCFVYLIDPLLFVWLHWNSFFREYTSNSLRQCLMLDFNSNETNFIGRKKQKEAKKNIKGAKKEWKRSEQGFKINFGARFLASRPSKLKVPTGWSKNVGGIKIGKKIKKENRDDNIENMVPKTWSIVGRDD